ncbi:MAG: hypothetical protein IT292_11590 [Deltaproteobacteria bacterium]|nr:hypothetical protein [Deltaproteobacteria bacterium]
MDKRFTLLLLLLLSLMAIFGPYIRRSAALLLGGKMLAVISAQTDEIQDIETLRNDSYKQEYKIDVLSFDQGEELYHPSLGDLGFKHNFFIDVTGKFDVIQGGRYHFRVSSDDGYRLTIDGQVQGEFLKDRSYNTDKFEVNLSKGRHAFKVEYFQRYSQLGLEVAYKRVEDKKFTLVGKDTEFLRFLRYR